MTSLLAPQFDVKGVALATDVDASVPLICHGDPGRIRQILINLVRNALKFTDRDAPAREMEEGQAAPSSRPENVLLAEDNAVNALLAIEQFKRLGFTLKVVADGRAAVEAVAGERFNLIFMDCHMPVMDGFEATRRIRALVSERQWRIPIVAMTADAWVEDRKTCLAAGMDDSVSKPVSLADLKTVIERWMPSAIDIAARAAHG